MSRRSFSLPALTEFDDEANDWILSWWEVPIIRSLLTDFGDRGLHRTDWDRPLTRQDLKRLHIILKDLDVSERILAIARERRGILIDYLLQEGMADGAKWALCDVGWRGTTQRCLAEITAGAPSSLGTLRDFTSGKSEGSSHFSPSRQKHFTPGMLVL